MAFDPPLLALFDQPMLHLKSISIRGAGSEVLVSVVSACLALEDLSYWTKSENGRYMCIRLALTLLQEHSIESLHPTMRRLSYSYMPSKDNRAGDFGIGRYTEEDYSGWSPPARARTVDLYMCFGSFKRLAILVEHIVFNGDTVGGAFYDPTDPTHTGGKHPRA
ncbi:hypothetical protein SEUCBS139899_007758 [Sporothrix eucalyptigena]|uniref:Uncharacterized protein n=1 Tax=Sporothrix eucalyptigena TaxID=1812306 RepID=A0ABP0B3D3_9PEZI